MFKKISLLILILFSIKGLSAKLVEGKLFLIENTSKPVVETKYKADEAVISEPNNIDSIICNKDELIFDNVDQQAEFPGGMDALMRWLVNNIHYPEAAQQNDIQGQVVVQFVVEIDGSISNPTILRGVDKDLDREALRVVGRMPKWQPGKNNGVTVRTYFRIPVNFRLWN